MNIDENIINTIAKRIRDEGLSDNSIFKAALEIDKQFVFLRLETRTKVLIKKFNKVKNQNIVEIEAIDEMPSTTIEDLFMRSLAINPENPYEYMSKRVFIINKNSDLMKFAESINMMEELSDNKITDYLAYKIPVFSDLIMQRIHMQFIDNFQNMFPLFVRNSSFGRLPYFDYNNNIVHIAFKYYFDYPYEKIPDYDFDLFFKKNSDEKNFKNDPYINDLLRNKLEEIRVIFPNHKIKPSEGGINYPNGKEMEIRYSTFARQKRTRVYLRKYLTKVDKIAPVVSVGISLDYDKYYEIAFA